MLQRFSRTVILDLINQMEKSSHRIGDVIYREGRDSDRLFFILRGSFKLIKRQQVGQRGEFSHKTTDKGILNSRILTRDNELSILSEMESFGEEVLIDRVRQYTMKCNQNDSLLYSIPGKVFRRIMHYYGLQEDCKSYGLANNYRRQLYTK